MNGTPIMSDLLLAADMSTPLVDYSRLPAGCRIVLGYAGGDTPHDWTRGEVAAAEAGGRSWWPIWTAPSTSDRLGAAQGHADGTAMVAALTRLGIADGRPVFYDIEHSSYAIDPAGAKQAWQAWQSVMHAGGFPVAYPYLPWSAGYGWVANWVGYRPTVLPAGVIGWQYTGDGGGRGYDLSVFSPALIGDTMEPADVWLVQFTSPTNGKQYAAREYLIGADVAARQASADVQTLAGLVHELFIKVDALAAQVAKGGAAGATPAAIAAGLGRALSAGAPKA